MAIDWANNKHTQRASPISIDLSSEEGEATFFGMLAEQPPSYIHVAPPCSLKAFWLKVPSLGREGLARIACRCSDLGAMARLAYVLITVLLLSGNVATGGRLAASPSVGRRSQMKGEIAVPLARGLWVHPPSRAYRVCSGEFRSRWVRSATCGWSWLLARPSAAAGDADRRGAYVANCACAVQIRQPDRSLAAAQVATAWPACYWFLKVNPRRPLPLP